MEKKIVILGAGPTGIGAGLRLDELGYRNWEIFERNNFTGGLSASFTDDSGFIWDIGGHIIFSADDRFNSLLDRVLGKEVVEHLRESWVWIYDRFIKYPFQNNFHFLDNEVVLECIEGLLDVYGKDSNTSDFRKWIDSVFGEGIARHFMVPYNRKVWGFPPEKMDAGWIAARVSTIDLRKILRNIILGKDDSSWGPNSAFSYPLVGGTGGLFEKMSRCLGTNLHLSEKVVGIDSSNNEVLFESGRRTSFDRLVSSLPVTEMLDMLEPCPEEIRDCRKKFLSNRGIMTGIGISKDCPSRKNWIYFPEKKYPFYRVTYLSNYSPNNAPAGCFSLLSEITVGNGNSMDPSQAVEKSIDGLVAAGFLEPADRARIVSTWIHEIDYSLPVPFLGRNALLGKINDFLESREIYSRGRFGAWKYEIGNMDHSVLMGMETIDRLLSGSEETVFNSC